MPQPPALCPHGGHGTHDVPSTRVLPSRSLRLRAAVGGVSVHEPCPGGEGGFGGVLPFRDGLFARVSGMCLFDMVAKFGATPANHKANVGNRKTISGTDTTNVYTLVLAIFRLNLASL